MAYDPRPRYAPVGGTVQHGWGEAAATLPAGPLMLAIDGPAALDWGEVVVGITGALIARGLEVRTEDLRRWFASWDTILARTESAQTIDDPDFARLPTNGTLASLFDRPPHIPSSIGKMLVLFGPGAGLVRHDMLWYVDVPKRLAEEWTGSGRARNLGQPDGAGPPSTRRLFFIDWPILDRHLEAMRAAIDRFVDFQDPDDPRSIDGAVLRRTASHLATRPFRTRPTFNSTPWGGHWAQRELRMSLDEPNTALGYELIAPEAGVLIGDGPLDEVEIPFRLIVAQSPVELLGASVQDRFRGSFPVRFDYLDTLEGGNLSVHCHPRAAYMRNVFGWPYTQHETYYVMVGDPRQQVFLGLRAGVDLDSFRHEAREADRAGVPFDVDRYVLSHPAEPHRLFTIPAGTPHGSGVGNVVLEVSSTPYLYSLRFYDWLRRDEKGANRPVHVDHAFANLNLSRVGDAVKTELLQAPKLLRQGHGWREELLSRLPEVFFDVRRTVLGPGSIYDDDTAGVFHVINVVDGEGLVLRSAAGDHPLSYAETLVIPAAVGRYTLRGLGSKPVRVVKALVRTARQPRCPRRGSDQ